MRLTVNGEAFEEAQAGWSVEDLLRHLGFGAKRVAVELNHDIVPRDGYAQRDLRDGDDLEILQFVGGGAR